MKVTVAELKKIVKTQTRVEVTGLVLSKNNPYWANSKQISYMNDSVAALVSRDADNSKRYVPTVKQVTSLNNWILTLEHTYLR